MKDDPLRRNATFPEGEVPKTPLDTLDALPVGLALTTGGFSEVVGVSLSVIHDRLSRGLLRASGRNRLLVAENVRLYCDELRAAAGRHGAGHRDPAKVRLTEAQAGAAELKLAKLRGELVSAVEVEREWSDLLRGLRAELLALPSRIGARVGLSPVDVAAVDREIRDTLDHLSSMRADARFAEVEELVG